jgi:hypothetical protein
MKRWLERLVVALAIAFVAVYGGDWAVFKLRGSPQAKVTVNHYMAIPLFPQAGMSPCWQLRRNSNQGMKI